MPFRSVLHLNLNFFSPTCGNPGFDILIYMVGCLDSKNPEKEKWTYFAVGSSWSCCGRWYCWRTITVVHHENATMYSQRMWKGLFLIWSGLHCRGHLLCKYVKQLSVGKMQNCGKLTASNLRNFLWNIFLAEWMVKVQWKINLMSVVVSSVSRNILHICKLPVVSFSHFHFTDTQSKYCWQQVLLTVCPV